MYLKKLRDPYTDEQLKELYKTPHDHTQWPDHIARVEKTIAVGKSIIEHESVCDFHCPPSPKSERAMSIADLSCGDAAITKALADYFKYIHCQEGDVEHPILYLGDYAPGYPYTGRIEYTIREIPDVFLFICCETLEHVPYPDILLKKIRDKTQFLLLSTPDCNYEDDNPEHLFAWDSEAIEEKLCNAGFNNRKLYYSNADYSLPGYKYQIWICR